MVACMALSYTPLIYLSYYVNTIITVNKSNYNIFLCGNFMLNNKTNDCNADITHRYFLFILKY